MTDSFIPCIIRVTRNCAIPIIKCPECGKWGRIHRHKYNFRIAHPKNGKNVFETCGISNNGKDFIKFVENTYKELHSVRTHVILHKIRGIKWN